MDLALGLLLRKTSSTPEVVPGAAPALAKAGVGGYRKKNIYTHQRTQETTVGLSSKTLFYFESLFYSYPVFEGRLSQPIDHTVYSSVQPSI